MRVSGGVVHAPALVQTARSGAPGLQGYPPSGLFGRFVISLCLFHGVSGIGGASATAQSVGELVAKRGNSVANGLPQLNSAATDDLHGIAATCHGLSDLIEGGAYADQFGGNDGDDLPCVTADNGGAGYALYRYALEVNHIDIGLPNLKMCFRSDSTKQNLDSIGSPNGGPLALNG